MSVETVVAQCIFKKDIYHAKLAEFCYIYKHDGSTSESPWFNIITEDRELKLVWKIEQYYVFHNNCFCRVLNKIVLEQCDQDVRANLKIVKLYDKNRCDCLLDKKFEKLSLPFEQSIDQKWCRVNESLKIQIEIYREDENMNQILKDYNQLLENGESSDVTFVVEEEKFQAHRLILSSRNSVFASMFKSDSLEEKSSIVEINDIQPNIFKHLLRFIYCGTLDDIDLKDLLKLIIAAEKYEMKNLVLACELRIAQDHFNVDDIIDILVIGDRVKATYLKKESMEFIFSHRNEVVNTQGYKSLAILRADLLSELFCHIPCK